MKTSCYILSVCWLLLIGSSQQSGAAMKVVDVELKSEFIADLCGGSDARRVLITINMGAIARSDSLFGFNFEVNYDTTKLRFNTPVYVNTLSELFEYHDIVFPDGKVIGSAVNFSEHVVYGSKPLIAFLGEFKADCPDTSLVSLSFIEFTDEFKIEAGLLKPAVVQASVSDKPGMDLKIIIDSDSVVFDNQGSKTIAAALETGSSHFDSLDLFVDLTDNLKFRIDSVRTSSASSSFRVLSVGQTPTGVVARLASDNKIIKSDTLLIDLENTNPDSGLAFLSVKPVKINDCTCVSTLKGDSVKLISLESDTTAVIESILNKSDIKAYFDANNVQFVFISDGFGIKSIEIYDFTGRLEERRISRDDVFKCVVNAESFPFGVHLAVIKTEVDKEYKLIVIKM